MRVAFLRPLRHSTTRSGFTLIELLTVIAVIGILSAISIAVGNTVAEGSRKTKTLAQMSIIAQGLEKFKGQYGDYPWVEEPPTAASLTDTTVGTHDAAGANGYELFRYLMGRLAIGRTADSGNPVGRVVLTKKVGGLAVIKYGPAFLELSGLNLERTSGSDALPTPAAALASPDPDFVNALLDAKGKRFLYFYKVYETTLWKNKSFVLLSVGENGVLESTVESDGSVTQGGDDLIQGLSR